MPRWTPRPASSFVARRPVAAPAVATVLGGTRWTDGHLDQTRGPAAPRLWREQASEPGIPRRGRDRGGRRHAGHRGSAMVQPLPIDGRRGARAGLGVHLVLSGPPTTVPGPNQRLDEILGAVVHVARTDSREDREALIGEVTAELRAGGHRPYVIGVGGSGVVGAVGSTLAGMELADQAAGACRSGVHDLSHPDGDRRHAGRSSRGSRAGRVGDHGRRRRGGAPGSRPPADDRDARRWARRPGPSIAGRGIKATIEIDD